MERGLQERARYFRACSNDFAGMSRTLLECRCEQTRCVAERNSFLVYTRAGGLHKMTFTVRTRRINAEECL